MALRVCADPANMPFSNEAGEGFENKLAELFSEKLGVPVIYTWFPQATGFVRQTLAARRCDIVMGWAQGGELVQNTNPYYRTSYVLIHRADDERFADVDSIADPKIKEKKIGLIAGTPPASVLAMRHGMTNTKGFDLFVDRRYMSPAEEMVKEIASGELDAGLLWGPIGGYYAKQSDVPMTVVPLVNEDVGPRLIYRITLGVRPNEPQWRHELNKLIAENQKEINEILLEFGVPILTERDELITAETVAEQPQATEPVTEGPPEDEGPKDAGQAAQPMLPPRSF
jgi:quinoprotein dehydrogenase-associated probable ABC transporter substrate-binding protein